MTAVHDFQPERALFVDYEGAYYAGCSCGWEDRRLSECWLDAEERWEIHCDSEFEKACEDMDVG